MLPDLMKAMVLEAPGTTLVMRTVTVPVPSSRQVLIKVMACGVCRTDLHIADGELSHPKLPLIMGHEVMGVVVRTGAEVTGIKENDVVGVPWLGYTCGQCKYCLSHRENLCDRALFTGYTMDGGFAEFMVADHRYCFILPTLLSKPSGAPLLCAGLIGYRSYSMIPCSAKNIGIYGFGAAAHILIQIANYQEKRIYAFTKEGDITAQTFALSLGAIWAGDSLDACPEKLDAAIIFAPVGNLVPKALEDLDKGGMLVCGGIHMSDIPSFPYKLLWEERMIRSVANLTRKDGDDFLKLAGEVPIHTQVQLFKLDDANVALEQLRNGQISGAAVMVMGDSFQVPV
jgi:propanol-preferring alcohol dehydrogenase